MTTIAVNAEEGVMAADTQVTDYNLITRMQKIYKLRDGTLVGMTGEAAGGWRAIQWLLSESKDDKPPKFKNTQLVFLRPDRTIWVAEEKFPEYPLLSKFYGAGSGGEMAMALMQEGKTAVEAVKATAKLCAFTSDPVQVLKLDPPEKPEKLKAKKKGP